MNIRAKSGGRLDDLIESAGRCNSLLAASAERRRRGETYVLCLVSALAAGAAILIACGAAFVPLRTGLLAGAGALAVAGCLAPLLIVLCLDQAKTRSMDEGATKFLLLSARAKQLRSDSRAEQVGTLAMLLGREHEHLLLQYAALLEGDALDAPVPAPNPVPLKAAPFPSIRSRHVRLVPRELSTQLSLEGGATYPARLIDVSMSGASLAVCGPIPVQAEVTVGRTKARVVRHHARGVAVEFLQFLSPRIFNEDLIL
jgi:hypothetical protein